MDYKDMINSIGKNQIKNLYLFVGEENYLIDQALKELKAKILAPDLQEFNFILIDGREASYEKIIDACETLPFMAEKKLVYIKELHILTGKNQVLSKKEEEDLIGYISQIPESTILVLYGQPSVDNRKRIIKEIKKHGHIVEFNRLKEADFNSWIKTIFKSLGKSIGPKELALFKNNLDYLGRSSLQSLYDVENEIKRLTAFMGEKTLVEKEDIEKTGSSSFHNDIFNLLDAIDKYNFPEAIERLNVLLDKGEPGLKILTTMGNQIKNTLSAKLLVGQGTYSHREIGSQLKIHPFVASKCLARARQFTIAELRELLNLFLQADLMIKSGIMAERLAIEMIILKMCKV